MHVAATYDRTAIRLYVNGVEESFTAYIAAIGTNALPARASVPSGSSATPVASRWFQGRLDDVRLYDRALSAAEIVALAGPGGVRWHAVSTPVNTPASWQARRHRSH